MCWGMRQVQTLLTALHRPGERLAHACMHDHAVTWISSVRIRTQTLSGCTGDVPAQNLVLLSVLSRVPYKHTHNKHSMYKSNREAKVYEGKETTTCAVRSRGFADTNQGSRCSISNDAALGGTPARSLLNDRAGEEGVGEIVVLEAAVLMVLD